MIKLSNQHQLEYVALSGALAFDGKGWPWEWPLRWLDFLDPKLFTIVAKTLTLKPRVGNLRWWNPLRCVRLIDHGVVNAVGLTNPGINWWCEKIGKKIAGFPYRMISSIWGESVEEYVSMIEMLNDYPLVGIELNLSCPNVHEHKPASELNLIKIIEASKYVSRHPLLVKLAATHNYVDMAQKIDGIVEAISINSVPWGVVYPDKQSPLANLGGGGVSGAAAQIYNWRMIEELAQSTTIPVIGSSIWEYQDLARVRSLGAKAIGFGSIFLRYPWRPTSFIKRELASFY